MIERAVLGLLCLLVAYASWVYGGSTFGYKPPVLWIALCMWGAAIIDLAVHAASGRYESARAGLRNALLARILRDPLLYPFIIFLLLLFLQWFNAGRMQYFDHAAGIWRYTEPFYTSLPSAVTKLEAREMFVWFVPPLTAALFIRSALMSRARIRQLFLFMVINAALLGVFGIVQAAAKAPGIMWGNPVKCHFFATFGYQNHAGEFFFLMLCLGIGLLFRHAFLDRHSRRWMLKTCLLKPAFL
jgi:hypothetical protein